MKNERKSRLLKAFKQVREKPDKENEEHFFKVLKRLAFWVPVYWKKEEAKISFGLLSSSEGHHYIPAFLEKGEMLGPFVGTQFKCFSYEYLKHVVIDDPSSIHGIAISPFEENIIISQELIYAADAKIEGMTVQRQEHQGNVKLWQPTQVPNGLLKELNQLFQNRTEVQAAWLLMAQGQGEPTKHWLLLVDFFGDKKVLFPQIAEVMRPFMKTSECFELMQAKGSFGENVREIAEPIYTKRFVKMS